MKSFGRAFIAAMILGIVNAFVRPLFILLTLPLTIITLGLFLLVVNPIMLMLAAAIVPGFRIKGFWWAVLFGVILSIVNSILFWAF